MVAGFGLLDRVHHLFEAIIVVVNHSPYRHPVLSGEKRGRLLVSAVSKL